MTPPAWVAVRSDDVAELAATWLRSRALTDLVARLGGPAGAGPAALAEWSAGTLDTRHGRERREAPRVTWERARIDALVEAAGPLGLRSTPPPTLDAYDATVVLGGAATGNRLRTELAVRLAAGGTKLGLVALVTAARPIGPTEHEIDPDSRADTYEWQNLLRHAECAFGDLRASADAAGAEDRRFTTAEGRHVRLLVAPPGGARARASTADAMRFFLDRVEAPHRRRVLLVTSAIYAPYQFFKVAPLLLAGGARHVELVGTATAVAGPDRALRAQRLAQEVHAAVRAANALVSGRAS